uniref:Sema domain-containing protein n=1 Tax=Panagrolaimus superbus TaxID=310955 RepID=A0A914Y475_9BILA
MLPKNPIKIHDHVYNLTVTKTGSSIKITKASTYYWPTDQSKADECRKKSSQQDDCRNYIRVFSINEKTNDFLICGTYSFKPKCRILNSQTHEIIREFSGTGLSPLNPQYNATFYLDNDNLYTATVSDFASTDALIYQRNITSDTNSGIRTERNNLKLLNKPTFAGSLHTDKYVYFFFREKAVEAETIDGYGASGYYSRVARVCKNDDGGPTIYANEWTTYVKARLNCSLPGSKQFYFDQIISISNVTNNYGKSDGMVYATYVSEYDFLSHSVICAFNINDIDKLFETSDYLVTDPMSVAYYRKSRDHQNSIGKCHNNSHSLSPDQMSNIKSSPLMADLVPNIFGKAVGIYEGQDHYNSIAIHSNVHLPEHNHIIDVIYVGTDQGNIIKMLNLKGTKAVEAEKDPLVKISLMKVADEPIRKLTVFNEQYLIVVTDRQVFALSLYQCQRFENCKNCAEARDPYCGWHIHEKSCMPIKKGDTAKHFLQSVIDGKSTECKNFEIMLPPLIVNPRIMPHINSEMKSNTIITTEEQPSLKAEKKLNCDCKTLSSKKALRECNCSHSSEDNTMAIKAVQDPVDEWYKSSTFLVALAVLQFAIIIGLIACYIRKTKKSKTKSKSPSPFISAYDQSTTTNSATLQKIPRPSSITKLTSPNQTAPAQYPKQYYNTPYSPTSSSNEGIEIFEKIHTVGVNDQGYASGSLGSKSGSDVVATLEGSSQPTPFNHPYISGGSSTASSNA